MLALDIETSEMFATMVDARKTARETGEVVDVRLVVFGSGRWEVKQGRKVP